MLTLEERERIAYITNSPDHPLIVLAIDVENDALDEMRHERDTAQDQVKDADEKIDVLEMQLGDRDEKIEGLKKQIHEAGIDLL